MTIRQYPTELFQMTASRKMRLRHAAWHAVRAASSSTRPEAPNIMRTYKEIGWELPAGSSYPGANPPLERQDPWGEDFLYMHRKMMGNVNNLLATLGESELERWLKIPRADDPEFPVPPSFHPDLNEAKNDSETSRLMFEWSEALILPANLRRFSLGALGTFVEETIHNWMHARWSEAPKYVRSFELSQVLDGVQAYEPAAEDLENDYLGDPYSSHVNPIFWYLHGWIDNLIDLWAEANGIEEIQWIGTWMGGPDIEIPGQSFPPLLPSAEIFAMPQSLNHPKFESFLRNSNNFIRFQAPTKKRMKEVEKLLSL